MTFPQTINASASPEVQSNENNLAIAWTGVYSHNAPADSGLARGYNGGRWGTFTVADVAHTFGASTTTYVSVLRSTGALDFNTASTHYNDSTLYAKVETVVTSASAVTSTTDDRAGPGGAHGAAAGAPITIDTDVTLAADSDAVVASQKAAKAYTDAKVAGLSWKQAARAATTANGTLATAFANGQTIDGVTLATGDRILVKNQSAGAENGIYTVNASGAPTRALDANSAVEIVNASLYVSEGTTLADTQWTCSTNAPITVNTTALVFAQLTSGGVTSVNLTAPAAGLTVAGGPITSSGSITLALADDLSAVEALSATGIVRRTASNTWSAGTAVGLTTEVTGVLPRANGGATPSVTTLTDGANIATDASLSDNFRVVLGGNRTLDNPTNPTSGQVLNFRIHQDGTGTRTLAYGNKFKFPGGTVPVLSTAASSKDFMSCQYDSTDDTYNCVLSKAFA